jgi:hypothetical protein
MKAVRFCKRTDSDHIACYYQPSEKPVWGDWIDNGTGQDYYPAAEVDDYRERVRALVEAAKELAGGGKEQVEVTPFGLLYTRAEKLKAAVAAVEGE